MSVEPGIVSAEVRIDGIKIAGCAHDVSVVVFVYVPSVNAAIVRQCVADAVSRVLDAEISRHTGIKS